MPKSPSLTEPSANVPSASVPSARKTLAALRVRCRVRHREPASSAYGCSLSNTQGRSLLHMGPQPLRHAHLEVAVQDLHRMHVLQRAAQLSHPAEHGELGEGEAGGLPPLDGLLDVASRGELHHDVQIALVLRAQQSR
eukprot:scaffold55400_cov59-Phaeocystis_antarctica.AAC.1